MEASEQTQAEETQEAPQEVAGGSAVPPGQEVPGADADRTPAEDQAPVATAAQEAIIGDPGFRAEQNPQQSEGAPTHVDRPVGTSMPAPELQSGMPLPEDRAAAQAAEAEKE